MNQTLMRRIRRKLHDEYSKEPLIGNVFFKKNSDEVFEIDECIYNSELVKEVQFNLFSFPKSREDSWNRMRRAGVLDKDFNELKNQNLLL